MEQYLQAAKNILSDTKTLPVLPVSAQRIVESTSDQFIDLSTVAEAIELEPVISARLVGIANSALYKRERDAVSVKDAIGRLGLDLTRGIAIGMACSNILDTSTVPSFKSTRYWEGSLKTSSFSSLLANHSGILTEEVPLCSLTGLLANIGLVVATALQPEKVEIACREEGDELQNRLIEQLGCSHIHLSAVLADAWGLPEKIQEVFLLRCEDISGANIESSPLLSCLHLANIMKHNELSTDQESGQNNSQAYKYLDTLQLSTDLETINRQKKKSEEAMKSIASMIT